MSHLVEREVVRNLEAIDPSLPRDFYRLIRDLPDFEIVYELPLDDLVLQYLKGGLKIADSQIAAFAEWMGAGFLVSENKHLLQELKTKAFEVVDAAELLTRAGISFR